MRPSVTGLVAALGSDPMEVGGLDAVRGCRDVLAPAHALRFPLDETTVRRSPSAVTKGRLEAFSDGVIAIIITIMVLELQVPHGETLGALAPLLPVLLSYAMSFTFVGIYWNNHHHLLHSAHRISGPVLWANLHWLFWLSLFPFVTTWMGENHFSRWPVVLYGVVSLASGVAYFLLARALALLHEPTSALANALGKDVKGKASIAIYAVGIGLTFVNAWWASPATWPSGRCGSSPIGGSSRGERSTLFEGELAGVDRHADDGVDALRLERVDLGAGGDAAGGREAA